jgi:two-component system KDP operon response regulator KdpE
LKPDPRILIIDNEKASRRLLRTVLEAEGYRVLEAESGGEGLTKAVECKPDVIVLEWGLLDGGELGVLQGLQEWSQIPVLVLSEQTEEQAKVAALDAGARDYLTKPFGSAELLARLRVLQRPLPNVPEGPLLIEGELVANLVTHEIALSGHSVKLTPKEEALFFVLARYAGKVVTCAHLMRAVWGTHSEERIHDLRVLVTHLRKKLGLYGGEILIRTEEGRGYSLLLSAPRESAPAPANS